MLHTPFKRLAMLAMATLMLATAFVSASPTPVQAQDGQERIRIELEGGDRPLDIIRQLREENLIPGGGKQDLSLRSTVINVRNQGFWYFPIGRGKELRDYVLHFEMRAVSLPSDTNGCGMAFRIRNDDDFSYVMLTKDRRIIFKQNDNNEAVVDFDRVIDDLEGIDASDYELTDDQLQFITIIAGREELILFVNGVEITRETGAKSVRGKFATMLFNEEGNESNSQCNYSNVFAWTFDE